MTQFLSAVSDPTHPTTEPSSRIGLEPCLRASGDTDSSLDADPRGPAPPPGERGIVAAAKPFRLTHGEVLGEATFSYELVGPPDRPVVVALGGISADRHVTRSRAAIEPGWWESVVGPGRGVDTDRFRVLGIDYLGGPGASRFTAAAPATSFTVDSRDQAAGIAAVCAELGLGSVRAVVGASYGGMVALALAESYPALARQLVVLSAVDRPHPRSTAWRSIQRQIVRLALDSGVGERGLCLARGLAMATYRSARELAERFDTPPTRKDGGFVFPIEEYLAARGRDFARRFSVDSFQALSLSIDLHRVDPGRLLVPTTLVGVRSDELIGIAEVRRLAAEIAAPCRLVELDSLYGHDAFLKEGQAVSSILREALAGEVAR